MFALYGDRCLLCGRPATAAHIIPVGALGGRHSSDPLVTDPLNGWPLCVWHHWKAPWSVDNNADWAQYGRKFREMALKYGPARAKDEWHEFLRPHLPERFGTPEQWRRIWQLSDEWEVAA